MRKLRGLSAPSHLQGGGGLHQEERHIATWLHARLQRSTALGMHKGVQGADHEHTQEQLIHKEED